MTDSAPADKSEANLGSPVGSSFQEVMRDPSARGAKLREDWRRSSERRAIHLATALACLAVALITMGAIAWAKAKASPYDEEFPTFFVGGMAFSLSAYVGAFLVFLIRRQQHRAWYDRAVVLREGLELQQAEAEASEQDLELASLWALTQRRLDYHHKIAMSQSEKSFTYGVVGLAASGLSDT